MVSIHVVRELTARFSDVERIAFSTSVGPMTLSEVSAAMSPLLHLFIAFI